VAARIQRERGLPVGDTWGQYSGGVLPRAAGLEEALRNALVPLLPHPASLYAR
jgi:hypothetical protein